MPIIRSWALTRDFALHPGTRNRYKIRYTRTQHRPASQHVNDHGRVSGTHRVLADCSASEFDAEMVLKDSRVEGGVPPHTFVVEVIAI